MVEIFLRVSTDVNKNIACMCLDASDHQVQVKHLHKEEMKRRGQMFYGIRS